MTARRRLLVAVGLGSNRAPADRPPFSESTARDPRVRALEGALLLLGQRGCDVRASSRLHATEPVGVPGPQPEYLNACALVETAGDLPDLLERCEDIERIAGRRTKGDLGARPLDLDLLAAWQRDEDDDWRAVTHDAPHSTVPHLAVPHPRLAERAFALVPLDEVAPDLPLPLGEGTTTARQHLQRLPDGGAVALFAEASGLFPLAAR